MKKIISFSLYGNKPNFQVGSVINVIEAARVYPDWKCRFYTTDDDMICKQLEYLDAEVVRMDDWPEGHMFWRFLAVDDADVCLSRDADSVVSERESVAVNDWLSNRSHQWHGMHDYRGHSKVSMMGGMWGYKHYNETDTIPERPHIFNFREKSIREYIQEWLDENPDRQLTGRDWDQRFLGDAIYADKAQHNIKWSGEWRNAKGNHFLPHYPMRYGDFVGSYVFWEGDGGGVLPNGRGHGRRELSQSVTGDNWFIDIVKNWIHTGYSEDTIRDILQSVKTIIKRCGGDVKD